MSVEKKAKKPSKLEQMVEADVSRLMENKDTEVDDLYAAGTIQQAGVRSALKRNRSMGDLDMSQIDPDPNQVRVVNTASDGFRDLVSSIREHGVIEPITVRWLEDVQRFQIITGERRFRAATEAGLTAIPAIVRDIDDTKKAVHQLVENIQRENMNPIDEAKAFKRYLAATGKERQELAREIGKDKSYVTKTMALLEKMTRQEQEILTSVAPAQLPGRSVIYEALTIDDPDLRASVLRGELKRTQLRERVAKKKSMSTRRRFVTKTFHVTQPEAVVTVKLKSDHLDEAAVTQALDAALLEQTSSEER